MDGFLNCSPRSARLVAGLYTVYRNVLRLTYHTASRAQVLMIRILDELHVAEVGDEPVGIENVMVLLNSLWVDSIRCTIMTSDEGATEREGREVYHCSH
jgi:hypothetical protein